MSERLLTEEELLQIRRLMGGMYQREYDLIQAGSIAQDAKTHKETLKAIVDWAVKERQKLKESKTKHQSKNPDDIASQIIAGAKAKAFQQVIDKWGSYD